MARRVFNSPAYVKPCVVDVAHKLLGSDNWVFLDGKAHIDYRKGLNGLFTRKALQSYLPGQEEVYNNYFKRFLQVTKVCITTRTYLLPKCSKGNPSIRSEFRPGYLVEQRADARYRTLAASPCLSCTSSGS